MADYRILVTGSRSWDAEGTLRMALNRADAERPTGTDLLLVHGACPKGADAMADTWARDYGFRTEPHRADWDGYGKQAGFVRNAEMVSLGASLCLVFLQRGAANRGTTHCAGLAKKAGIPVHEIWSS